MKSPRFEVWRGIDGEWRWHLKARNGEIQAQGEGYKTKRGALSGVESFRRNSMFAEVRVA